MVPTQGASLASRQIHLDFHTGPAIPDVGAGFDPEEFARVLVEARVNSVTLFAKCHHGHLYYRTDRRERHPGLRADLDLLEAQMEACRASGIRTPVYISVQCDEFAANEHPDWVARKPDGSPVKWGEGVFAPGWQILDMSSPYADFLAEQVTEIVSTVCPRDGLFFDMCWDQASCSKWAIDGMRDAGLNPEIEHDRDAYARRVARGYMGRYNEIVSRLTGEPANNFYNSRPKLRLAEEAHFLQHVEIEALPTGGWGYTYFPLNVRLARNFGLPFIGMTGRFHRSWSDFGGLKPFAALKYEVSQMLAHGAQGCSIGDQLHPRGTFDRGAYNLIGRAFEHVEQCMPFCEQAVPVTEVAVLRDLEGLYHLQPGDPLEGVVRLLQQTSHQFDFVHSGTDLSRYRVVIVPDGYPALSGELAAKLDAYVEAGGRVLVCGATGLHSLDPRWLAEAGVQQMTAHAFQTVYLRYSATEITGVDTQTDHVLYEPSVKFSMARDGAGLGRIVEPYFDRRWDHFCGHNQVPPATLTQQYAVAVGGRIALFGFDLFKLYARHGILHVRQLFESVMKRLLPNPLLVVKVPRHVETTVTRQKTAGRDIVHLLSYIPQRRTPDLDLVEEPTPLLDVEVRLRASPQSDRPRTAMLQPVNRPASVRRVDGYDCVQLSSPDGHVMIVFE